MEASIAAILALMDDAKPDQEPRSEQEPAPKIIFGPTGEIMMTATPLMISTSGNGYGR